MDNSFSNFCKVEDWFYRNSCAFSSQEDEWEYLSKISDEFETCTSIDSGSSNNGSAFITALSPEVLENWFTEEIDLFKTKSMSNTDAGKQKDVIKDFQHNSIDEIYKLPSDEAFMDALLDQPSAEPMDDHWTDKCISQDISQDLGFKYKDIFDDSYGQVLSLRDFLQILLLETNK